MLPLLLDLGFSLAEIGLGVMGVALAIVGLPPGVATPRRPRVVRRVDHRDASPHDDSESPVERDTN